MYWRMMMVWGLLFVPRAATAQLECCYRITGIDSRTGVVSATETSTGLALQFQVRDRLLLGRLRLDQPVYADLAARRVGLDARQACCAILGIPVPAAAPARAPTAAPTTPVQPVPGRRGISNDLPTIAFGPPQPRTTATRGEVRSRFETRAITTTVAGRSVSASVLHLRGLRAVEQAPGLPDDARRLLIMAVRRIPRGQSDQYVVNVQRAQEWFATRHVPDNIKPTEPDEKKCDNWYDSFDCAGQAVTAEWQRAFDHAVDEWQRGTKQLADIWETTQDCFAEQTLTLSKIPLKFDITPSMTVNLDQSGARGSAAGKLTGTVGFGVPTQADFAAQLELFYIPCLPFAVRPKALSAEGILTVGQAIDGRVTASGRFDKTFTFPPTGGPVIPIQVFPIIIGGVPVSEIDVSAYVEGNIAVSATGEVDGRFQLTNAHPTRFAFTCDGAGCKATSKGAPAASTSSQGVELRGRVSVKPAIFTALQLDFNYEALSARAGPQPFVLGIASGCGSLSATQTTGGPATAGTSYAMTGDLDWGVELRAEALVLRNIVGTPYVVRVMQDRHVWFRDLVPGGSSGLGAVMDGPAAAETSRPARYNVRMSACYPYTERVEYRVRWTGNATPGAVNGCSWETGGGTCRSDPRRELPIVLTWAMPGNYTITVTATGDTHGRTFVSASPAQVTVNVAASS